MKYTHMLLFGCLVAGMASADIVLNDQFTDNERSAQNLPDSAAWFSGGSAANISAASSTLVINNITGGTRGGLAYFTDAGSPVTLGVGDSLTLQADITILASSGDTGRFRFMTFDSGASRTASDNQSFNNSTFSAYTGYGIFNDPIGVHPARYALVERTGLSNNLTVETYSLGVAQQSISMTGGLVRVVSLQLTRSSTDTIDIVGSINGNQILRSDSVSAFTSFDTLGIFSVNDTLADTLTIDNVVVTYTAAIPEPTSAMLLVLGLAVCARALRHRLA